MVNTRAQLKKIQRTCKKDDSDDHQPSESGEAIGSNDDLLIEILRGVPAQSILRFKSVSKQWYSLLSDREFALLYDRLSVSRARGLFYGDLYVPFNVEDQTNNRPPFHSLDFYEDVHGIRIVQSCNGLLLCSSQRGTEQTRKYYVFNPTTKQFAVIGSIKGGPAIRNAILFMGLAFHPIECKQYKLVCVYHARLYPNLDHILRIQIYSSETKRWTILNKVYVIPDYQPFFRCGVYLNGAIYWAPSSTNSWFYFKLDEEKLQKLELPSSMKKLSSRTHDIRMYVYYFGESRGNLHLVEMAHRRRPQYLNVYEMLSDHSGWVVKFKVRLDQLLAEFPEVERYNYHDYVKVLDVVRGEKEGDTFMVVKFSDEIKSYNILNKSFNKLFDVPRVYGRTMMESRRYIETLGLF